MFRLSPSSPFFSLSETTTTCAELYWDGAISLWDMGNR